MYYLLDLKTHIIEKLTTDVILQFKRKEISDCGMRLKD